MPARKRRRRLGRWLAVGAIALVALLYYRPVKTYLETRAELEARRAEVRALEQRRRALELRLERTGRGDELVRQARRLGLVKPGERLFIVKGVATWRRAQAAAHRSR